MIVLTFPWLERRDGEYPYADVHSIVRAEAERAGLEVEDLTAPFLEAGLAELRIDSADLVHPSRLGHRVAAERLQRRLEADPHEVAGSRP